MRVVHLAVDFGSSHTVAVIRRGDGRIEPLLFDGSPLLPSAVYAGDGATTYTAGTDTQLAGDGAVAGTNAPTTGGGPMATPNGHAVGADASRPDQGSAIDADPPQTGAGHVIGGDAARAVDGLPSSADTPYPQDTSHSATPHIGGSHAAGKDTPLIVGADALRAAHVDPAGLEPHPKRRVGAGTVRLSGHEYPVVDLFAAVLGRVVDQCREIGTPEAVTLTHPVAWGPVERAVLREAAKKAGLRNIRLLPEPVAAALYHARETEGPDGAQGRGDLALAYGAIPAVPERPGSSENSTSRTTRRDRTSPEDQTTREGRTPREGAPKPHLRPWVIGRRSKRDATGETRARKRELDVTADERAAVAFLTRVVRPVTEAVIPSPRRPPILKAAAKWRHPLVGVGFALAVAFAGGLVFAPGSRSSDDDPTMAITAELRAPAAVAQLRAIGGDGGSLAVTGSHDGRVQVWDLDKGALVSSFQTRDNLTDLELARQGELRLAVTASPGHAEVRRLSDTGAVCEIDDEGYLDKIEVAGGAYLVSDNRSALKVWRVADCAEVGTWPLERTGEVQDFLILDATTAPKIVLRTDKGLFGPVDAATGALLDGYHLDAVSRGIYMSAKGGQVVVIQATHAAVWDPKDGTQGTRMALQSWVNARPAVYPDAEEPDRMVTAVFGADKVVRLYDLGSGRELGFLQLSPSDGARPPAMALTTGHLVTATGRDITVIGLAPGAG